MESAKRNIKKIVDTYIETYPNEFATFREAMNMRRKMVGDKFASISENTRALYEMPETLYAMLVENLTIEQMKWLKQGGADGHEGGHWFARNFPVFCLPEKI